MGYSRRQALVCTVDEIEKYSDVVLYKNEILHVTDGSRFRQIIADGVSTVKELYQNEANGPIPAQRSVNRLEIAYAAIFEEHISNSLRLDLYRSRWGWQKAKSLEKRVINLEKGVSGIHFSTDESVAYEKVVPADVLPYAAIESVGDAVTAVKSFGGNKVLSDEAVLTPSFQSMTVTDLGGGKFQFDGYTSWQDGDKNWETNEYNKHTFLSVPLKAGVYCFSTSTTTGNTDLNGAADSVEFALIVNGINRAPGFIVIAEDTTVHLAVSAHTGGEGQSGYIGSFELFKVEGYENAVENHSDFIPNPCDTLTIADLGNGNFQFDGYTEFQSMGTYYTFLKMPLKAGTYKFSKKTVVEDQDPNGGSSIGFEIAVNGSAVYSDSITVTQDSTAEIKVALGTGGAGVVGMVLLLVLIDESAITREVIETLTVPFGDDTLNPNNLIAVEPMGKLVFENEGNNAVASTVLYTRKGE